MEKFKINNGEEIIIREAEIEDAEDLLNYVKKVGAETDNLTFGEGEFDKTVEDEEKFIKLCKESNNKLFLLAENDHKVISSISLIGGGRSRTEHIGDLGITVLKEYWNNGVGTKMMEYAINWAEDSEVIRKINLYVREDNEAAIHLYEKLGFEKEGKRLRDFKIDDKFYSSLAMGLCID